MAVMPEPITTPKPAKPLPAPNADSYEFARTLSGIAFGGLPIVSPLVLVASLVTLGTGTEDKKQGTLPS